MIAYTGSCHCGAIHFRFEGPPITGALRCNCSVCRRKGAAMSNFIVAPDDLQIIDPSDRLATYVFGGGVARHHFCKTCGIYPFHQTLRRPGHYRINIGCIDGIDPFAVPVDLFDGASL